MKKKLLFIMPSMESGGAEKSLATLLSLINYEHYDAELFLFCREGLFLDLIPQSVKVTDAGERYRVFDGSLLKGTWYFLKNKNLPLALARWHYAFVLRRKDSVKKREKLWSLLSRVLPAPTREYAVAIGCLEGNATYYCADCVKAEKKLAFVHSDYGKLGLNPLFDARAYESINTVITVSPSCKEGLLNAIASLKPKAVVIENIVRKDDLERMAAEPFSFDAAPDETVVVTIARLAAEKGIDLAVLACASLVREGERIKWIVLGDGPERETLATRIREYGLEQTFILAGQTPNPYKYLARCDVYVQPSRYEGKSIALEEAKRFAKPIVTTAFSTVRDQIEDGVTGLIADADPASLAASVRRLVNDRDLRQRLSERLAATPTGNENEMEKFIALLEVPVKAD